MLNLDTRYLKNGVALHVIPTQQFSTIRIVINFSQQQDRVDLGGRVLAANMLETVSNNYSSQVKLARQLSTMAGTDFDTEVLKVGALHMMRLQMTAIDLSFVEKPEYLLSDLFNFLKEVIWNPMGNDETGFDLTVFERQRDMALDELAGLKEDKSYYAVRQAMMTYFDQECQALPAFGNAHLLNETTALSAWQAWKNAVAQDQIDIVVLGDIEQTEIETLVAQWPFTDRHTKLEAHYHQDLYADVQNVVESQQVNQTRLIIGYQLMVNDGDRFKAYVFNALFGGLAVSRLFMHVREQAGLAYAIYSDYNFYTDLVMIEAGIDKSQVAEVERQIEAELLDLQTKVVSVNELETVKKLMMADYRVALDQPYRITEKAILQETTHYGTTEEEWLQAIDAVTADDIQQIGKKLVKQLRFVLSEDK